MEIKSFKELQKVISLCRKAGVVHIKLNSLELTLGPAPKAPYKAQEIDLSAFPEANIPVPQYQAPIPQDVIDTDELSQEELMFYSAGANQ